MKESFLVSRVMYKKSPHTGLAEAGFEPARRFRDTGF